MIIEAVGPAFRMLGKLTLLSISVIELLVVCRSWCRFHVGLEHVAVLLKRVKGASILENVLVSHDSVEDDQT